MRQFGPYRLCLRRHAPPLLLFSAALFISACHSDHRVRIAVIPQTEGNMLWDPAHIGAEIGAKSAGVSIYWNAPTREDDVEGQIALVDHVIDGGYQGLALAPDQALSLISPVRRALEHKIPTVILGSSLAIPAGGYLSYILNDDEAGGEMAAERAVTLMKGHGTVAVLGINADVAGIMVRARAFEQTLARIAPGIHIVSRRSGTFNFAHEQQVAEDVLKDNPDLDVIVALMGSTIDGSVAALESRPQSPKVRIIGFDAVGLPLFRQREGIDSVIQSDTRAMAEQAVELICANRAGQPTPSVVRLRPRLICRENENSAEVHQMLSTDWTLGHWPWSSAQ